jgi:hypothetical protein
MNIKNINECFSLLKQRMNISKTYCFNKKQTDFVNNQIKKLTNKIEKYKQSFNKQEYEHYCDLYYVELFNRNTDVPPPEHTQFATFN